MKLTDKITLTNEDNMELMSRYPDKYFDLGCFDPPYGIGEDGSKNHTRGKLAKAKSYKGYSSGDINKPSKEYITEAIRVSKNWIFWGANHYVSNIAIDSSCWIIWDKENGETDQADCEIALTSFETAIRVFRFRWQGMLQGDMKNKEIRIHPNQKPVALYKWILRNYAKEGDKILDTHLGSMSIAIACHDLGFELTGCELDKDYYQDGIKRVQNHINQLQLFI